MTLNFNPPLIAHRGASALAPENTFAAFIKAKECGVNWVEFDVMLTSDEHAVVIHDDCLERTTTGAGLVSGCSLADIQTYDAGTWFHPEFKNEKVPTLKDVIAFLGKNNMNANVEIKSQVGQEETAAKVILQDIADHWPKNLSPPLISSFSLEILQYVRMLAPQASIGLLIHDWFPNWEDLAKQLNCATINVNHEILSPSKIKLIKDLGKPLLTYTVNNPVLASSLFKQGIAAVFTDNVKEMMTCAEFIF